MIKKLSILLMMTGLILSLIGWRYVKQDKTLSWKRFEFVLPQGWGYMLLPPNGFLATKDGQLMQQILMGCSDLKQKESNITEDMPPQEIAEILAKGTSIIVGAWSGGTARPEYTIIDQKPAKISGFDGFRLTWDFKSRGEGPVKYKAVCYWFFFDKTFYTIRFIALEQHYFDKDLSTFEQFIGSFKIRL